MNALRGEGGGGRGGATGAATRPRALRVAVWVAVLAACAPTRSPEPPVPAPGPPPPPVVVPDPLPRPLAEGHVPVGAAGRLWYRVAGSAPDTVIVPLGSWLETSLAPLANRYALLFYDPRSRGRSDALRDTSLIAFEADVEDLEAVRSALGVSRAALIGYHYYGAVAAAYAARHPDRVSRLVLLSAIEPTDSLEQAFAPPNRVARLDTLAARRLVRMRAEGRDTSEAALYCRTFWEVNAKVFVGDTAQAVRVVPDWCDLPNETPATLAPVLARRYNSLGPRRDLSSVAARVQAPTLVVHGTRDLVVNPDGARTWAALVPQARLWLLPGVGHLTFFEAPDVLLGGLRDFLRGEWPIGALPARRP